MKKKWLYMGGQKSEKGVTSGVVKGLVKISLILLSIYIIYQSGILKTTEAYRDFPVIGSRLAVWIVAELHLLFAAFVLAVPIFAVIAEYVGYTSKDERYDKLAKEMTKLLAAAFTITAILGSVLFLLIVGLYPDFFKYMKGIFSITIPFYVFFIIGEVFFGYLYWYSWDRLKDNKKLHILIGIGLNFFGTAIMFTANSWGQFMLTPGGIAETGELLSIWGAIKTSTWMPMNVHRFIANIAFGGFVVAAYAAYKFLSSSTREEKAHYDWMGYVGNFIGLAGLIPLPFAGYWMGREVYIFNEQLGITMMGGIFSWLFVIQAVLILVLFLGANYYLWLGMGRIPGGERYSKYRLPMLIILIICFAVWMTPHSLVGSPEELRAIGATFHPVLGVLGVMSAKNTAVNLVILTTFFSFLLYKRANIEATVSWEKTGKAVQSLILLLAALVVVALGVYGYFVPAVVRVGLSIPQVEAVLFAIVSVTIIDIFLFRNAKSLGEFNWGDMPNRSQYTLITLASGAVLLMGLMGYFRSASRQAWHVFGAMKDTHPGFWTPSLGEASMYVGAIVFVFYLLLALVFWLGVEKRNVSGEEVEKK